MPHSSTAAPTRLTRPLAEGRGVWLLALVLVLAALAAYSNAFSVPFVFEDEQAIMNNATIRQLWPPGPVLSPPANTPVSGRPLLNLSLALNHAISGYAPWSYHAVNLMIHALAGLTLFGLVRRTLRQPALVARFGQAATGIAFVTAGLWLLHPLQTGAVTYVTQRAESLMGLWYLLALYGFVRATTDASVPGAGWGGPGAAGGRAWLMVSVVACFLGMATKEVMVTAPLLVLMYDRAFVAGSFAEAWRERRGYYVALAVSWLLLAGSILQSSGHAGAGFNTGIGVGEYLVTQAYAIALYLKLALWPSPLVIDYGPELTVSLTDVWAQALLVIGLVAATTEAVCRRSPLGFAGVWFFGILAPSSSWVPVASQTLAEHRMYLPLAAVILLAVLGLQRWAGRAGLIGAATLALGLGWLTHQRNETYRSDLALWTDTLEHRPGNIRALHGLGQAYSARGHYAEAIPLFQEALRLDRGLRFVAKPAILQTKIGHHLVATGRPTEALPHYQEALQLDPYYALAHHNLAVALLQLDRPAIALRHFREALRLNIGGTDAQAGLAASYLATERIDDAIVQYREALRVEPDRALLHAGLGEALRRAGRSAESEAEFALAKRLEAAP